MYFLLAEFLTLACHNKFQRTASCARYSVGNKTQDILSTHPLVLAEMERIDVDLQMAKDYADNTDLILRRKAEYRAINISHI